MDIDQLENFSKALGRTLPISSKGNKSDVPAYRVQFSDVAYYDFLLQAGLTPTKSKTITKIAVPDAFYADFLRGVFDGDGSCYAYMDKRWRSSYMFYVTFTAASPAFLHYLQDTNSRLLQTTKGSLRLSGRAYILSYAKTDARKLFKSMYHSTDIFRLQRKFNKFQGFTLYKQSDKIQVNARVAEPGRRATLRW